MIKAILFDMRFFFPDYTIDDEFNFPIKTAMVILLVYALIGSVFFYMLEEEWGLFGSLYFIFVTFSTVGLGDLVPQVIANHQNSMNF
jgi:hypothetical protein